MKNKRKFFRIVTSVLLAFILSAGNVLSPVAVLTPLGHHLGEVSAEGNIIHITNYEELKSFAKKCHIARWSDGKHAILEKDIAIPDDEELMIASFGGIFDGNGHTISNITLKKAAANSGLFGIVLGKGRVSGLRVSGRYKASGLVKNLGGICGANYGTVENCTFDGFIKAESAVGGIVGQNMEGGTVVACVAKGRITGDSSCGGVVGYNNGVIRGCTNRAEIDTTYKDKAVSKDEINDVLEDVLKGNGANGLKGLGTRIDVGGIAGLSEGEIHSSTNEGIVGYEHVGYNIGGVCGRSTGLVRGCSNEGIVYGHKDVGGIVGQQQPYLVMNFEESDLARINNEVAALNDQVTAMLGDVSGYSNETTGRLLEISNLASGAIDDVHKTTDDLGRGADDMNDTIQSILDQGDTSVEELENYVDSIEKSIDEVEDNLDNLSDDAKLSDSDKESIRSSIQGIRNNINQFDQIKNRDRSSSFGNKADAGDDDDDDDDNDDDDIDFDLDDLDLDLDDDTDSDDIDEEEDDPSAVEQYRSAAAATSDQAEAILAEVEKYVIKSDGDLWTAKEELKEALAQRKTINRKDITLEGIRSYNERVKNSLTKLKDKVKSRSENTGILKSERDKIVSSIDKARNNITSLNDNIKKTREARKAALQEAKQAREAALQQAKQTGDSALQKAKQNREELLQAAREARDKALAEAKARGSSTAQAAKEAKEAALQAVRNRLGEDKQSLLDGKTNLSQLRRNVADTVGMTEGLLSDLKDTVGDDKSDLRDSADALQDTIRNNDKVHDEMKKILDGMDVFNEEAGSLSKTLQADGELLYGRLGEIVDAVNRLAVSANADIQSSIGKIKEIQRQADQIRQDVYDVMERATDPETYKEDRVIDVSDEDVENATSGRTTACTHSGSVDADSNVGGITGGMSYELDLDKEEDYEEQGSPTVDFVLEGSCIVDKCMNYGKVKAHRSSGGGIAGRMALGLVTDCRSLGDITVKDGYCGGIAGYSASQIRYSYSKATLSGDRYVGGIAGYGTKIHDCLSMSFIKDGEQFVGQIAGSVEEINIEEVHSNHYYAKDSYGIDDVSYAGIADGISYEQLSSVPGASADFLRLVLTFTKEDKDGDEDIVIKTIRCGYGDKISKKNIPAVPKKKGFVGTWSRTDFSSIKYDEVIKAKYKRVNTLIESDLKDDDDKPVLFAEGHFKREDMLRVKKQPGTRPFEDGIYTVGIPNDGEKTHVLRYCPSKKDRTVHIFLYGLELGNGYVKTGTEGKYLTFRVRGAKVKFGVIEYWNKLIPVTVLAIVIAALIVLGVLVIRFKKGKFIIQRIIRFVKSKKDKGNNV